MGPAMEQSWKDMMRFSDLLAFATESNIIEGIKDKKKDVEHATALNEFLAIDNNVLVTDLQAFVSKVQPGAQVRHSEGMDVRVGNHIPPRGGQNIVTALCDLLDGAERTPESAYRTHLAYEYLHPFMDGNGRSGRALWLWQMKGTTHGFPFLHMWYYQSLDNSDQRKEYNDEQE